jgi:hypothetical protein
MQSGNKGRSGRWSVNRRRAAKTGHTSLVRRGLSPTTLYGFRNRCHSRNGVIARVIPMGRIPSTTSSKRRVKSKPPRQDNAWARQLSSTCAHDTDEGIAIATRKTRLKARCTYDLGDSLIKRRHVRWEDVSAKGISDQSRVRQQIWILIYNCPGTGSAPSDLGPIHAHASRGDSKRGCWLLQTAWRANSRLCHATLG